MKEIDKPKTANYEMFVKNVFDSRIGKAIMYVSQVMMNAWKKIISSRKVKQ